MKKITNDTYNNSEVLFAYIEDNNISGADVFNMFEQWHGNQLFTKEMLENLQNCEGYELEED